MDEILENGVLSEAYIVEEDCLRYIPKDLHPMMTPTFYQGYIVVMDVIRLITAIAPALAVFAENPFVIPTTSAVMRFIDRFQEHANCPNHDEKKKNELVHDYQCAQAYFSSGRKVEFGLDALTDLTFEISPGGPAYHQHPLYQEEEAGLQKIIAKYPRCENDMDFGLVREKLGLPREKLGPYWFSPANSGEDDDNDEEQEQDQENEEQDEDDSDSEWETVYEIIPIPYY